MLLDVSIRTWQGSWKAGQDNKSDEDTPEARKYSVYLNRL